MVWVVLSRNFDEKGRRLRFARLASHNARLAVIRKGACLLSSEIFRGKSQRRVNSWRTLMEQKVGIDLKRWMEGYGIVSVVCGEKNLTFATLADRYLQISGR